MIFDAWRQCLILMAAMFDTWRSCLILRRPFLLVTAAMFVAGGLDEALRNIIRLCEDQRVPVVFALGRRALGRACAKLVPVSVVGLFSYEGAEVCTLSLSHLDSVFRRARFVTN